MTSEPRVNCQRGGKGLVRVGLSDKGVGTSTPSFFLFSFPSLVISLAFSRLFYSPSLFYPSPYPPSLSPLQPPLARYGSCASSFFFSSFRIPNFIFIGRRFWARARFVARISWNNGLPRGELNRKRIKSFCHPAPLHRLALWLLVFDRGTLNVEFGTRL